MPEKGILTRTYFVEGQVPDCPRRHMHIKWTLVMGYLIIQRHTSLYQIRGGCLSRHLAQLINWNYFRQLVCYHSHDFLAFTFCCKSHSGTSELLLDWWGYYITCRETYRWSNISTKIFEKNNWFKSSNWIAKKNSLAYHKARRTEIKRKRSNNLQEKKTMNTTMLFRIRKPKWVYYMISYQDLVDNNIL